MGINFDYTENTAPNSLLSKICLAAEVLHGIAKGEFRG